MKILIANRGEIAVRVMRACRELRLPTVAVYSEVDRTAPHVRYADEAYPLAGNDAAASYLAIDQLLDVAQRAGATAVHPGYGFLAENPVFAQACADAGLTFIGPSAGVMARMGSKTAAREAARRAGVPIVPGSEGPIPAAADSDAAGALAAAVGYPLLVKAVAGGGGKGMRLARTPADLPGAMRAARSEASSSFGDSEIYFERRLERPRHVEIQVLGDAHGQVVAFVERECSIQRRHQKVVEEAPSVAVGPALRERLATAAVALVREVGYQNAGTLEFLLDEDGRFYFLEMNTRLQVEHPITELVTGVDLVHWQIRIAQGEALTLDPAAVRQPRGHAIECRVYAEDPDNGFLPSPGRIDALRPPSGPGVRDDSGVEAGSVVPVFYDSLISKLVVWGGTRSEALARLRRALSEYEIAGVATTLPFFRWLVETTDFVEGLFDTTWLDRELEARAGRRFVEPPPPLDDLAAMSAALHLYMQARDGGRTAPAAGPRSWSAWRRAARVEAQRPS